MNILGIFSSDYREIYKADVYKSLSLPKDYIIHFRYKPKYIDPYLFSNLDQLKGKYGCIFFVPNYSEERSDLEYISIRDIKVANCIYSENTDVVHLYLLLSEYCNYEINNIVPKEKLPPKIFVSEIEIIEHSDNNNWKGRIEAVNKYFSGYSFININNISQNETIIIPSIVNNGKNTCYDLLQGNDYRINISFANPNNVECKIGIIESQLEMSLFGDKPIYSNVQYDDLDYGLSIKNLQIMKQHSMINIVPIILEKEKLEYSQNIDMDLNLDPQNSLLFALLTLLAVIAYLIIAPASESTIIHPWWQYVISLSLLFFSSATLFFIYNKK
jgi:hypothetical protein